MMVIDKTLSSNKTELLSYFRDRASEALSVIKTKYGEGQPEKRASAINAALTETRGVLISALRQKADKENWSQKEILECLLMITYSSIVVMIESRNSVRPYEYMDFSRRIGELWDPFCKLCFYHPVNDVTLFIPPLFSEVRRQLNDELIDYINTLTLKQEEKDELIKYYNKVWTLVMSGEIQLELDLHFIFNGQKYVADFKSGFGSNEKGNTNRLLLVASIYKNLPESHKCLLLVRADQNNNYYNTLKNSGIWNAYSGSNAYEKIKEFSGYDLRSWIDNNIDWSLDFDAETTQHLKNQKLLNYLKW